MTVRKTPSGLWVADVTVGRTLTGERDRRQSQFKTKREAEVEDRKLQIMRDLNQGKAYGRILFEDFLELCFWPQKEGLRFDTKRCYVRDINNRLMPAFHGKYMEDIGRFDIQRMISSCPTKKVATNARETLSSIMSLAVEMSVLKVNPAGFRYIYPPATRHPRNEGGEWLSTFADIKRVLEYVAEHYEGQPEERICVLGLGFGLRKGEIFALDAEDIDPHTCGCRVMRTLVRGESGAELNDPKTDNAFREVPAFSYIRERVSSWGLDTGPIVTLKNGQRMKPQTGYKRIDKVFNSGQTFDDGQPLPKLTIFSMRHSFGTSCIDAGIEVAKLAKWMGHADVSTTYNNYVKPRQKDLVRDTRLIDEAFESHI